VEVRVTLTSAAQPGSDRQIGITREPDGTAPARNGLTCSPGSFELTGEHVRPLRAGAVPSGSRVMPICRSLPGCAALVSVTRTSTDGRNRELPAFTRPAPCTNHSS